MALWRPLQFKGLCKAITIYTGSFAVSTQSQRPLPTQPLGPLLKHEIVRFEGTYYFAYSSHCSVILNGLANSRVCIHLEHGEGKPDSTLDGHHYGITKKIGLTITLTLDGLIIRHLSMR